MFKKFKSSARFISASIITIILLGMSVLLAGPAAAASEFDSGPPVVLSVNTAPTTIDVTNGPQTITVQLHITDETSVSEVRLGTHHKPSGQLPTKESTQLVSGDYRDGTWEYKAVIPMNAAAGIWTIELSSLSDRLGLITGKEELPEIEPVTVISANQDVTPPTLVTSTISRTSVDVSQITDVVFARLHITDPARVTSVYLFLKNLETGRSKYVEASLSSGTERDGVWTASIYFSQYSTAGTWEVSGPRMRDSLGNLIDSSDGPPLWNISVISPPQDIEPPVIQELEVSPTSVDVSSGPATVRVRSHVTDASGARGSIFFGVHEQSGQRTPQAFGRLISGTDKDGVWEAEFTIPQNAASGVWNIEVQQSSDVRDNLTADPWSSGELGTFTVDSPNEDIAAPESRIHSITPNPVDVSNNRAIVRIHVQMTDASGVDYPAAISVTNGSGVGSYGYPQGLISGTIRDGIWEYLAYFPKNSPAGVWTVMNAGSSDIIGNRAFIESYADAQALGSIEVINEVFPSPVNFIDSSELVLGSYTIPSVPGISYQVNGEVKAPGTYVGTDTIRVVAQVLDGFTLTPGATTEWTYTFTPLTLVSATPTITGTTKVGTTLTAYPGIWTTGTSFKYQWYRSGVAITGATAKTYALTTTDVGKAITVKVTGSKTGYTTVAKTSAPSALITSPAPTLTSATPIITGTTKVGYTLTANPGTWTTGTAFAYQWYRAGIAITGATTSTYKLAGADAGKTITVKVTGTKTGYTTVTKTSVATAAVSYGTLTGTTPTITGTKKVGYTLTTNPGTWTSGATLRYQWYRSGAAITGATASTYKLAGADAGKTITVKVTSSKLGYVTIAKTSAATTLIAKGTLVSATPTISGTKKVGYTLTANTGIWTAGTAFTYQWYRSGVAITGATAKTYKPTGYDVGKSLTVKVTGSQLGYTSVAKTSAATALIARGTLTSATPIISGTKKVGYTLTANTGTWTYGTTFKYQWYRSGVAITGATAKTYKLTSYDVAKSLTVKVTGSKFGYTTVAKTSAATALIVKGTLVSPTPTITGTKTVGYTLTANPGTWTYGTTLTYRWYRSGVAITGATAKTYKLTSLDRGKTMTVRVTGTKAGYVTVSKYSAATVKIV